MKVLHSKIFLLLFLFAAFLPSAAEDGIFTDMLLSPNNVEHISSIPSSTAIFQKNLGAANHVQWARKLPGTGSSEQFLSSISWKNTRNDFLKNYGRSSQVQQHLNYQEHLFRKAIKVNNIASSRSVNIKGNVGESIMDLFYAKDGWEKIDGKRGRNGFDGLYVKRRKSGRIYDYLPAESKTGSSRPGKTQHGIQGSREWVKHNVAELLKSAKEDCQKYPSPLTKKRFDDLSQIVKLRGRETHFHKFQIVKVNGKICVSYDILSSDFSAIKRSQLINMQTAGRMQQLIYKNLEYHISIYDPQGATSLVKKIENGFKRGTIKNDSDLYRLIKREIPDKKLARAVAQELGEEPPRGSLAEAFGEKICKNSGIIIRATAVAGFIIAQDAMRDGITSDTFIKAGVASSATVVTVIALDHGMDIAAHFASEQLARYILPLPVKRATERTGSNFASKLVPTVSRVLGGTLQVAFALYFIGDTIYNYNMGSMTQTDMIMNVGIVALTTAGTVFFTWTEAGAAFGTAIFPGLGTAAGSVIGAAIGFLGGAATGGYMWYVEDQREKRLQAEARALADWETQNNKARLDSMIDELEQKFEKDRMAAWRGLGLIP